MTWSRLGMDETPVSEYIGSLVMEDDLFGEDRAGEGDELSRVRLADRLEVREAPLGSRCAFGESSWPESRGPHAHAERQPRPGPI